MGAYPRWFFFFCICLLWPEKRESHLYISKEKKAREARVSIKVVVGRPSSMIVIRLRCK